MRRKTGQAGIAIDTNMLLAIPQFKVDVLEMAEELLGKQKVVMPEQVYAELSKFAEKKGKTGREAKIALNLAKKRGVKIVKVGAEDADSALLKLAERGFIIATNDKALRKSAKRMPARVLYLRKTKFVEIG